MRRPLTLLLTAAVAASALLGCGTPTADPSEPPSATPAGSPSGSPTPTPEPEPEPELTAIVIGPDGIELLAGGTTLGVLGFADAPDEFLARLTAAIGSDPTVVDEPGDCCHFGPSTRSEWPGLRVTVPDEPTVGSQNPPILLEVTAEAVGAVELRTREGYRVGDDCFAIAATEGASLAWSDSLRCDIGVDFGLTHGAPEVDGYPNANTVELIGGPNVSQILAPANLGIGRV